MHMSLDTDDAIVSDIKVVKGSRDQAAVELTQEGFNYIIDADFNYNTDCDPIYVGYKNVRSFRDRKRYTQTEEPIPRMMRTRISRISIWTSRSDYR